MKKIKYLLVLAILSMGLVACSLSSDEEDTSSKKSEKKSKKEQTEETVASDDADYTYSEKVEAEYDGDVEYTRLYELYINDDTSELIETNEYEDGHSVTYKYFGSATVTDDKVVFEYMDQSGDSIYVERTTFTLSGKDNEVSAVESAYLDQSTQDMSGTYTGHSDEFGDMTLVVTEGNEVTLTMEDGTVCTGSLFLYNEKWDLMVNDEDYTISLDWICEFDGDTFTYEEYTKSVYGKYAGDYKCFGDLGEFVLHVDAYGGATATIVIDGKSMEMSGSIEIDSDEGILTGAYLSSYDSYGISLELMESGDDGWNYSGYYAVPLGAG